VVRAAQDTDVVRQIGELTELALGIERRRLRLAQDALSGASAWMIVCANWMRPLSMVVAYLSAAALAAQHGPAWLHAVVVWLTLGVVQHAPVLDWQIWLAMVAIGVMTSRTAATLAAGFTASRATGASGAGIVGGVTPSQPSWRATSGRRPTGSASL
jgi:hypothetical protein